MKSPWDNDNSNKSFDNFFKEFLPNDFFNFKLIVPAIIALIFAWLASGIYSVDEGAQGIVTRFGVYNRKALPGLNYRLPTPIEAVVIEKVNKSRRTEIGYRSYEVRYKYNNVDDGPSASDNTQPILAESIMLTGDENILYLNCDVMWHIKDLKDYVFNVLNPGDTIKLAAESAIREVISKTPIAFALSSQKQQITDEIQKLTQEIIDMYNLGVDIENVQLLKAEPPPQVISYYRDVQTAKADKEKEINQAYTYMNDVLPRARGQSAKITQEAEGYKQVVISRAQGEAQRFNSILVEYTSNKQLTKDRLYFDTMESILFGANKTIIGADALPHMALTNKAGN